MLLENLFFAETYDDAKFYDFIGADFVDAEVLIEKDADNDYICSQGYEMSCEECPYNNDCPQCDENLFRSTGNEPVRFAITGIALI